jgi:hypothetical protein
VNRRVMNARCGRWRDGDDRNAPSTGGWSRGVARSLGEW